VLAATLALSLVEGVLVGAVAIAPGDVLAALAGSTDGPTATIVRDLRVPRVLAAAIVGAALAVAGVLLQGLTRNPLADPYVTGSSAGGVLGAVVAIALLGPLAGGVIPLAAFAGALLAVAVVWQLARLGGRTTVLTVLLAGIVLTAFSGAVVTLLLVANDRLALRIRVVVDVLVGAVNIRSPGELVMSAAIVALGIALALLLAPRIDAYAFGEETAATLGVDTDRVTALVLASAALLAGAAVALAGLVGFVGLVVPHALRPLLGAAHRRLVAASALAGASALVLADAGSRVALAPAELPVGVITGLVGAPFFLALLVRSRRIAVA
jgi:iron complex transport system permease protein